MVVRHNPPRESTIVFRDRGVSLIDRQHKVCTRTHRVSTEEHPRIDLRPASEAQTHAAWQHLAHSSPAWPVEILSLSLTRSTECE
jgi:hypothetical protein